MYIGLSLLSNPNTRELHLEGRRILELLNESCFPGRGPEEIGTEKGGRPFFTAAHADFSISHSRNIAAVAYGAEKKAGTGCDIQYVKPMKNCGEIARRYFSPEEQGYIAAAPGEPEQLERFYRIWVLKECFLKARGLSVFEMRTAPSFAGPEGLAVEVNAPLHFFLYELGEKGTERYLLAAAQENGGAYGPSPEFRWYSKGIHSPPPPVVQSIKILC
ncbi:hypothetical protein AGMMS49942_17130 [Spirochaetia bacterium]|nr:hypothetical protein AGMMS49942_17130 [Spirochaetia bacterium]